MLPVAVIVTVPPAMVVATRIQISPLTILAGNAGVTAPVPVASAPTLTKVIVNGAPPVSASVNVSKVLSGPVCIATKPL
jgi:hypothetical protein